MSEQRYNEGEERLPAVFEPDTMLASQYFDRLRGRAGRSGEWLLMIAILEDAVSMYVKHAAAAVGPNQRLFAEAEAWIEDPDRTWIFSFESICDIAGLDPGWIRNGLRAYKRRARASTAEAKRGVAITLREDARRQASGE